MEIEKLFISLMLDAQKYSEGLDKAQKEGAGWSQRMRDSIGGGLVKAAQIGAAALLGVGVAIAGVAVAGVNSFVGFQNQMNEVFTLLPGITSDAMDEMSGDVLQFSRDFAVLPEQVVPALYQALSAGVPPDNVFSFLETAQMAAVGGITDLETAVDGITSVVNAYGAEVVGAAEASDIMFTAVRLGKTDFGQLSSSLFNVIPTAASLGITFEEVAAGLATLTAQGTPTSVATTQLRQLFVEASKSGSNLDKTIRELTGQGITGLIEEGRTVTDVLQEVRDAVGEEEFRNMFGSVEALNAALGTTGPNVEMMRDNLDAMNDSAGATKAAYDTMNQGIERAKQRFLAFKDTALIEVGAALAPVVGWLIDLGEQALPTVEAALGMVTGIMGSFFANLEEGMTPLDAFIEAIWDLAPPELLETLVRFRDEILPGIVGSLETLWATIEPVIATVAGLVTQFVSWKDVALAAALILGGFLLNVIIGIVAALAPVVIAVGLVIAAVSLLRNAWENNWGGIQEKTAAAIAFVQGVIQAGIAWVTAFWAEHGDAIRAKAIEIWQAIRDFIGVAIETIRQTVTAVATALQQFWAQHGEAIQTKAQEVWQFILNTIRDILAVIEGIWLAFMALFNGEWEEFGERIWNLWELAWTAVLNYITGLWALMKPILESVWQSIKSWWGGIDWPQLGRDIVTGIVSGLSAAGNAITDFLRGLITAAIGDIRSLLGIASPSRVMAELVGEPMGQGLIAGWEQAIAGNKLEASLSAAVAGMGGNGSYSSQTTVQLAPGQDPLRALRASRHLDRLGVSK